jgi:hypothetical protein
VLAAARLAPFTTGTPFTPFTPLTIGPLDDQQEVARRQRHDALDGPALEERSELQAELGDVPRGEAPLAQESSSSTL